MATDPIRPPLKYHGGKQPLARRIAALMPPHTHYVEPFAGGLAVLFARDPEGVSEVANDLHGDLSRFWRVLACPLQFVRFERLAQAAPFSESCWRDAESVLSPDSGADDAERALAFFVRCRQSLAGRMRSFAVPVKTRTRRGMNDGVSAWLSAVEGLPAVHERLKRVLVLDRPALDVVRQQDGPATLFYCDPPYLHATRAAPDAYRHEMDEAGHAALLDALLACAGKVVLSGYPHPLYETRLAGWRRIVFDVANHAAGGAAKRRMQEVVWCNFDPETQGDGA